MTDPLLNAGQAEDERARAERGHDGKIVAAEMSGEETEKQREDGDGGDLAVQQIADGMNSGKYGELEKDDEERAPAGQLIDPLTRTKVRIE